MDLPEHEESFFILRSGAMMGPTKAVCMSLCHSLAGRMMRSPRGNRAIMMCMDGIGPELSNCSLICGIGVWFGTFGVAAPMSCINLYEFCCILCSYASGGRSVTLPTDRGNMYPLTFGRVQRNLLRLPRKMMLGRRWMCVYCAATSTLQLFVVNAI